LSGGRLETAICVATWASVNDRRPKGVVGVRGSMSCPHAGKGNLLAETAPRLLTVIRGSGILSVAKLKRRLPGR